MLRFRLYQFSLDEGERIYALLPKLGTDQLAIIEERLASVGYAVSRGESLRGVKRRATITVDPRGICWSNEDIADVLAPVLPRMLMTKKQVVPLQVLSSQYFQAEKSGGAYVVNSCREWNPPDSGRSSGPLTSARWHRTNKPSFGLFLNTPPGSVTCFRTTLPKVAR